MKLLAFGLIISFPVILTAQRPCLTGYVTEQNSGKKRVEGVIVKAATPARTNNAVTGFQGDFTLIFQDMTAGQSVNLMAEKKGWQIVNEAEMRTRIPEHADGQPLKIILCPAQKLELARKEYYEITDRYITREYKKQLVAIDRTKTGWQQKAKELNEHLTSLRKQIIEIAEAYTRTNLDDLTETEKQAFELFKTGRIEEGIRLRNSMNSNEQLQAAIRKGHELDSAIVVHTRNLKRLATEYSLVFDFKNAERVYQELVDADTTNVTNIFAFISFLQNQNKYTRAVYWVELALRHATDPYNITIAKSKIAQLYHEKKEFAKANSFYNEVLEVFEYLTSVDSITYQPYLASVFVDIGALYKDMKEYSDAERLYLKALNIFKRLSVNNEIWYKEEFARTLNNLGSLYYDNHDFIAAENAFQEALAIYQSLAVSYPQNYEYSISLMHVNLGNVYRERNDLLQAEKAYRTCLEIRERLAKNNPQAYIPGVAGVKKRIGLLLYKEKKYTEALAVLNDVLNIYEQLAEKEEQTYAPENAEAQQSLGIVYRALKDYNNAGTAYKKALKIGRELIKTDTLAYAPGVALTLNNLGNLYREQKKYQESEAVLMQALQIYQLLASVDSAVYELQVALALNNLGVLYRESGENLKAEPFYLEAVKIRSRYVKKDMTAFGPDLASSYENLGNLYRDENNLIKAKEAYQQCLVIRRQLPDTSSDVYQEKMFKTLNDLANTLRGSGEYANAEAIYMEALDIRKKQVTNPEGEFLIAETWHNLGLLYLMIHKLRDAQFYLMKSFRIRSKWSEINPKIYQGYLVTTSRALMLLFQDKLNTLKHNAFKFLERDSFEAVETIILNVSKRDSLLLSMVKNYYYNRCWHLLISLNFVESEQAIRKILDIDPNETFAQLILAHALLLQDNSVTAEKIYLQLVNKYYGKMAYREIIHTHLNELQKNLKHSGLKRIKETLFNTN